jgi:hypothetical protein
MADACRGLGRPESAAEVVNFIEELARPRMRQTKSVG